MTGAGALAAAAAMPVKAGAIYWSDTLQLVEPLRILHATGPDLNTWGQCRWGIDDFGGILRFVDAKRKS